MDRETAEREEKSRALNCVAKNSRVWTLSDNSLVWLSNPLSGSAGKAEVAEEWAQRISTDRCHDSWRRDAMQCNAMQCKKDVAQGLVPLHRGSDWLQARQVGGVDQDPDATSDAFLASDEPVAFESKQHLMD